MRIIWVILLVGLCLGGCSSAPPAADKQITLGNFKTKILRGKTSQEEVMRLLGSPSITTTNAQGNPVWTYTRQPFDRKNQSFAGGITLYGGDDSFTSSSSSSYDIILTFDSRSHVQDYSVIASEF
ncbi:MAG: hypothetical protein R3B54_09720 [Bdellovibrionota bacterium]